MLCGIQHGEWSGVVWHGVACDAAVRVGKEEAKQCVRWSGRRACVGGLGPGCRGGAGGGTRISSTRFQDTARRRREVRGRRTRQKKKTHGGYSCMYKYTQETTECYRVVQRLGEDQDPLPYRSTRLVLALCPFQGSLPAGHETKRSLARKH